MKLGPDIAVRRLVWVREEVALPYGVWGYPPGNIFENVAYVKDAFDAYKSRQEAQLPQRWRTSAVVTPFNVIQGH